MIIAKIVHYLLWRNNRRLWTKQTLLYNISHCSQSSLYRKVTATTTWQTHGPLDYGAGW